MTVGQNRKLMKIIIRIQINLRNNEDARNRTILIVEIVMKIIRHEKIDTTFKRKVFTLQIFMNSM